MILPVATSEEDFREIDEGDEEVEVRSRLLMGRVEYSDELGLARWSQQFAIIEYAKGRFGGVTYTYMIEKITAPRREPMVDDEGE